MAHAKRYKTTIRMGATVLDLTVAGDDGTFHLDLPVLNELGRFATTEQRKERRIAEGQRSAVATALCETLGIQSPVTPTQARLERKGTKPHGKHPDKRTSTGPSAQHEGQQDVQPPPARNGPKKQGSKRRQSGPLPATGHPEQRGAGTRRSRPVRNPVPQDGAGPSGPPHDGDEGAQRS